jgi:hypothetical protein
MGTITFQLPEGVGAEAARELERACMAGGPDSMPWPTDLRLHNGRMVVSRAVDESGYLVVPWDVAGMGQVMGVSATLIERTRPYDLLIELARGKVNQVRCQASDWQLGGVQIGSQVQQLIREASHAFGRAVTSDNGDGSTHHAQAALSLAYQAADLLVKTYVQQVLHIRHQRQALLDSALGCAIGTEAPHPETAQPLTQAFNTLVVPLSWSLIEPEEGSYRWDRADALVAWAVEQDRDVMAGPLIDFSASQLPAWLWAWERDLPSLATFMCKLVEATVRRYRGRIRRWRITAASNCSSVLSLSEDDLLGLTYRLAETARQVDTGMELILSIAQPWGEYMALADRTQSPFVFADTLIRSGLNLAALDLEILMGAWPRGSYCRDLLEVSRLLDLYALLGVPLHVTLGYPAGTQPDPGADPELRVGGGHWGDGFTPAVQAQWAEAVGSLCLCKPFVQGVQWIHYSDAWPHQMPGCGLVDAASKPRPALQTLHDLRAHHLRPGRLSAANQRLPLSAPDRDI